MRICGHAAEHQRKNNAECHRRADAEKPNDDEAGGEGQRARRPKRAAEVPQGEGKPRTREARCNRKEGNVQRDLPGQLKKAGQQCGQPRHEANQGGQRQRIAVKRAGDKDRHELKKRAAHQKAQPTDRNDMDQDERLRRLDRDGGNP